MKQNISKKENVQILKKLLCVNESNRQKKGEVCKRPDKSEKQLNAA